jgi:hypothetical protein
VFRGDRDTPAGSQAVYVRAGLEFESRSADWKGSPFLATSGSHGAASGPRSCGSFCPPDRHRAELAVRGHVRVRTEVVQVEHGDLAATQAGVSLPVVADVGTDLQERDLRRQEGVVASTSTPVVPTPIMYIM